MYQKQIKKSNHKVTVCNISLGANDIVVNIENYTITDVVYIAAFYDMPSTISIFKSMGTNLHVVNQRIDLMQLDCQNILISNCQIRELDVGLAEHYKALKDLDDETCQTAYKMNNIDIRRSQISAIRTFIECECLNIQESVVDMLLLQGGFGSKAIAEIKKILIWNYTSINVLEIYCKILNFELNSSTINNLVAKSHCKIEEISIKESIVLNSHNFVKNFFNKLDYDAWYIISKSADNIRDLSTKSEANYKMAKQRYKSEKGFNKFVGMLFGFCTGYGYKPMRALGTCAILVFVVFLILAVNGYICSGKDFLYNLSSYAAIAISAIAGQSGLQRTNGFIFWIATVEYISEIIIFAMFVNALYVRYKD